MTDFTLAANLIEGFEGYIALAKWDVDAYRLGYGSDTEGPEQVRVTKGMHTTRERAFQNLVLRIPAFEKVIIKQVGEEAWNPLTNHAKAALLSFAYNYGDLYWNVEKVVAARKELAIIASAIEARKNDDKGVNEKRRLEEAAFLLKPDEPAAPIPSPPVPAPAPVAPTGEAPLDLDKQPDFQRALNILNAPAEPLVLDGVFGPKTIAAIKLFQAKHNLTVNGLTSVNTLLAVRDTLIAKGVPLVPIT